MILTKFRQPQCPLYLRQQSLGLCFGGSLQKVIGMSLNHRGVSP
jgi:hypothetical protein